MKRAFLAVSDKTGLVDLSLGLKELGFELLSSGGTANTLKQLELEIVELPQAPGVPPILERRLRFLQPALLGSLLADHTNPAESNALETLGQPPLELVAINFPPLSEILEDTSLTLREVMEYVNIGTGALLRAAARNFDQVIALCDPSDYPRVLETLRESGDLSIEERRNLASKAFHYAAYYDSTIAQFLMETSAGLPDEFVMGLKKARALSYGENPHQRAAVYALSGARRWGLAAAKVLHGKDLSFNHFLDLETAWELAGEFEDPACILVKHTQPCGAACADRLSESFRLAWHCDPAAAHRAAAAFNRPVDEGTAREIDGQSLECVLAPDFSQEAVSLLRRKKDLRLVTLPSTLLSPHEVEIHSISGGLLIEDKDNPTFSQELRMVTKRPLSDAERIAARFAWKVAKHAKSDACVLAKGLQTVGIGAGQPTKLDAVKTAVLKAGEKHPILDPQKPLVMALDGPLPVGALHEAVKAGVQCFIQSGGSSEDRDAIRACDQHNVAMAFVGLRHYRH